MGRSAFGLLLVLIFCQRTGEHLAGSSSGTPAERPRTWRPPLPCNHSLFMWTTSVCWGRQRWSRLQVIIHAFRSIGLLTHEEPATSNDVKALDAYLDLDRLKATLAPKRPGGFRVPCKRDASLTVYGRSSSATAPSAVSWTGRLWAAWARFTQTAPWSRTWCARTPLCPGRRSQSRKTVFHRREERSAHKDLFEVSGFRLGANGIGNQVHWATVRRSQPLGYSCDTDEAIVVLEATALLRGAHALVF